MTEQELSNILKTIRAIPEGGDEMAMAVLKAAADSISMDKLKALTSVEPNGKEGNRKAAKSRTGKHRKTSEKIGQNL